MFDRESQGSRSLAEHEQAVFGIAHSENAGDDISLPSAVSKALSAVRFLDEVRQAINYSKRLVLEKSGTNEDGDFAHDLLSSTSDSRFFGPYRLECQIGQGGFADVFLAFDPILERNVALKILRPSVVANTAARIRFEREARAVARLGHPNIVPLFSTGTVGPFMYLAFEYCEGDSLAAWLKGQSTWLDCRVVAKLVIDLAEALEHAHRRGVIHRDVKPSNIMIKKLGDATSPQPLSVMITDFGLASLGFDSLALTKVGSVLGTPHYMSPEQANSMEVTTAADIYSLGVVMFELLTLRLPFEYDNPLSVLKAVSESDFPSPTKHRRDLQPDLVAICLKATQNDWRKRYRTAFDFAEDLRCWLDHRPVQARRLNFAQVLAQKIRRQPFVSGLIALSIVSVLFGTSIACWQWAIARSSSHQATQQARRAEQHLSQLSLALDRVLHSIPEPEAITPSQHEMLNDLLEVYQTLVTEEQGNRNVGRDTIRILNRLVRINALLARHQDVVEAFETLQTLFSDSDLQRIFAAKDFSSPDSDEITEIYFSTSHAFNELECSDRALALLAKLETLVNSIPTNSNSSFRDWFDFRLEFARGQANRVAGHYELSIQYHQQAELREAIMVSSSERWFSDPQVAQRIILNQSELARSFLANGNYLSAWETQQSVIVRRQSQLQKSDSESYLHQRVRTELARDHLTGVSILSVIGAVPAMREQLSLAIEHLNDLKLQAPDSDIVNLELQEAHFWMAHIGLMEGDLQKVVTNARIALDLRFSQQRKLSRRKIQEVKTLTVLVAAQLRMNDLAAATITAEHLVSQSNQLLSEYPTNVPAAIAWAKAINVYLSVIDNRGEDAKYGRVIGDVKDDMARVLGMRLHPQEKISIANHWSERKSRWVVLLVDLGEYAEACVVAQEIYEVQIPTKVGKTRPNVLPATKALAVILQAMKKTDLDGAREYQEMRDQAATWLSDAEKHGWVTAIQWRSYADLVQEFGDHPRLSHSSPSSKSD